MTVAVTALRNALEQNNNELNGIFPDSTADPSADEKSSGHPEQQLINLIPYGVLNAVQNNRGNAAILGMLLPLLNRMIEMAF